MPHHALLKFSIYFVCLPKGCMYELKKLILHYRVLVFNNFLRSLELRPVFRFRDFSGFFLDSWKPLITCSHFSYNL